MRNKLRQSICNQSIMFSIVPAVLAAQLAGWSFAQTTTFPPRLPETVKPVVKLPIEYFDLADVRLNEGPFKEAMETDHAYLLRLEPDRFLAWFRKESGLTPKGKVYQGWESAGVAGHSLGHYLSACAHMYRATGDEKILQKVNYIVDELAECQAANGNGYVGAIPNGKQIFAEIAKGDVKPQGGFNLNGGWVPWYTVHKVMAGLLDSADLCGSTKARDVLLKMTDWVATEVSGLNDAQMQTLLSVEQGGMPETLANVYAFTGDAKYLALAKRFRHEQLFVPMSQGKDILNGWHGNANIPKIIGFDRIYELTGESAWGDAADHFWKYVAIDRSFVTGGHGLYEHFFPLDKFDSAMHSTNGPETCNSYNMLKLTTHLFAQKPAESYIEFYERALYNHILPSQHPGSGGFVYYTPLSPGSFRTYSNDTTDFWCCVGTGMENHALYGQMIYARSSATPGDKLLVNLFIPSELSWTEAGAHITQSTTFPTEPRTSLKVKLAASKQFTISIRYPSWVAGGAMKISVNGQPISTTAQPGEYADISRLWNDGDLVEVELPMAIHTEMLPHNTSYVSVMYGPIVLAGELGRAGLVNADFRGQLMADRKMGSVKTTPAIVGSTDQIAAHIQQVPGKSLTFQTHDLMKPGDVTLAPLYDVYDQRTAIYWRVTSAENWQADQQKWADAERAELDLAARTVDVVRSGEQQPEVDHQFKGERTNNGNHMDRGWRDARDGGWFSYTLKIQANTPQQLLCTYWGSDDGKRHFDILIDNVLLTSETLNARKPNEFVDVSYPIPEAMLKGKTQVVVKFQAKPGEMAGGLFGCRIVK